MSIRTTVCATQIANQLMRPILQKKISQSWMWDWKHDREFEKLGYKVKGIDLSPKMIEIAETECIKANLSLSAAIFENIGIAASMIFVHRCFVLLVIKYQFKT